MTDNEIIKALECCTKSGCLSCPLYTLEHTGTCVKRTMFGTIDLINRQKAEIETLKAERNNYKKWYFDTVEQLKTAKSEADVVEVVRCKDCKYCQDNNGGYPHIECRWSHDETPNEDDYCSYGERKENEQ